MSWVCSRPLRIRGEGAPASLLPFHILVDPRGLHWVLTGQPAGLPWDKAESTPLPGRQPGPGPQAVRSAEAGWE